MKHGPNALIDENLPVVVLATRDPAQRREPDALREDAFEHPGSESARGYRGGDRHRGRSGGEKVADHVIEIPPTNELLLPILEIVPLQLLAYHIAVRRGCDVDQPRNLAKSVTVEYYLRPRDFSRAINAAGSSEMIASTPASISRSHSSGLFAVHGTTCRPAACAC